MTILAVQSVSTELLSGRLATFGIMLGVLIVLLAGWAAVFNYLRNRHKLRMRETKQDHEPRLDAWAEAGRRLDVEPGPDTGDADGPDDDEDDDDDDDDGDVPSGEPKPSLTPAAAG